VIGHPANLNGIKLPHLDLTPAFDNLESPCQILLPSPSADGPLLKVLRGVCEIKPGIYIEKIGPCCLDAAEQLFFHVQKCL